MEKRKQTLKEIFAKIPTKVTLCDGSKPWYPGCIPQKQKLYFGCSYTNRPAVIIEWREQGRGFGEYCFQVNKKGQLECKSELDSRETVKRILCTMVDQCIFTEINDPKERTPKWLSKAKSNSKPKSRTRKSPRSRKDS